MPAPIYAIPLTGTRAQQYLHRAKQFRDAAAELVGYRSSEPNWPKYALLTHAIELALKAFAFHSAGDGPIANEPKQHDLVGWYNVAVSYGLEDERTISENINLLHEMHNIHFMRYPKQLSGPVPNLDIIVDQTVEHLITTLTAIINPR
jgi:hypothetical protein